MCRRGIPSFTVVGLPDASCREARDRVRAAILSSGLAWPQQRVTVNLAPTGVRKGGAGLDLPIAVALLAADGQFPADSLSGLAFLGELGLDGSLRRVPGVLPLVDALPDGPSWSPRRAPREAALVRGRAVSVRARPAGLVAVLRGEEGWPDARPVDRRRPVRTRRARPGRRAGPGRSAGWPWRWRPRVATTSCWSVRRGPARRCWPSGCPGCCRPLDADEALEVSPDPLGGRHPSASRALDPPPAVPRPAPQRVAGVADRRRDAR